MTRQTPAFWAITAAVVLFVAWGVAVVIVTVLVPALKGERPADQTPAPVVTVLPSSPTPTVPPTATPTPEPPENVLPTMTWTPVPPLRLWDEASPTPSPPPVLIELPTATPTPATPRVPVQRG